MNSSNVIIYLIISDINLSFKSEKMSVKCYYSLVDFQKTESVFLDEEMMTRVYGKASYQKGRTTVKDPYLHFKNSAKQKPSRPVGTTPVKGTVKHR